MSLHPRRDIRPVFLLLVLAVASVQAQTSQSPAGSSNGQIPTIKTEARIVVVDVVVTQRKGEPVVGLHKQDLQVSEDGRAQTISSFEEHTGGTVSPVVLPPMPPDVYTNYPTLRTTDSINVLLLDSLNTQATDQVYVRPQMVKYLRSELAAPTGARLAIFTLGQTLRMVRGFTVDSAASLKALIDPKSGTEAKFEPQIASPSRIAGENLACDLIRSPAGQAACRDFLSEERAERTGDRTAMTLQAFQVLSHYLSQFPGRKNVMWISGSFPVSFFPETSPRSLPRKEYRSDIRRTVELLTADQVAVYPISARALAAEENTHPDQYGRPIDEGFGDASSDQIAMEMLARNTGGRAFYNTNDLSNAMTEAINSGSNYYTLTYTPTNTKADGKYRQIELKVMNSSYKLSYRRGYYAETSQAEREAEQNGPSDLLLRLMGFGMPDFAEILYKVRVAVLQENKGSSADATKPVVRYGLDFAVLPQDVKLESGADGVLSGDLEVAVIAYDADGKVLNAIGKTIPLRLQPDAFAKMQRVGFQLHEEIDLPQSDLFLQTGIYDLKANHAGTFGIPLHVATTPAASK
jgi:VWFA-related protein